MKFNFDNVAISGGIAVGTSTLLHNLKPYLEPHGFQFRSTGQYVRDFLKEYKNPKSELVSEEMDRKIEDGMHETFKNEKNWVIEAWLAGFVARDLDNTLRVLLVCSEPSVRIDRVVNRENVTIDEAKKLIREREEGNLAKWKRQYGDHDFWDPKKYHVVIDTYSSGPLQTVGVVLDHLGYKS